MVSGVSKKIRFSFITSAPSLIRTGHLWVRNPTFYPNELWALEESGGGEIRTRESFWDADFPGLWNEPLSDSSLAKLILSLFEAKSEVRPEGIEPSLF